MTSIMSRPPLQSSSAWGSTATTDQGTKVSALTNEALGTMRSPLSVMVHETLTSYPTNGQLTFEDFLKSHRSHEDENENDIKLFQDCWTKAVMVQEAFGRKGKAPIDSLQFTQDITTTAKKSDRDLIRVDALLLSLQRQLETFRSAELVEAMAKADNAAASKRATTAAREQALPSSSSKAAAVDLRSQLAIHAELQTMLRLSFGKPIASAKSINNHARNNPATHCAEAILILKQYLRKHKVSLSATAVRRPVYCPLSISSCLNPHQSHAFYQGSLQIKTAATAVGTEVLVPSEIPPITTADLLGIHVPNTLPNETIAWCTFRLLHDYLFTQQLNIFPVPVGAQRDSGSLGVVFIFESPAQTRPLSELLSPRFVSLIRSSPGCLTAWCLQLALAHVAISQSATTFVEPLTLNDVFVRSDGRLLLGHLAFVDPAEESASLDHDDPYDDDDIDGGVTTAVNNTNDRFWEAFTFLLLSSVLGLSRSIDMALQLPPEDLSHNHQHHQLNHSHRDQDGSSSSPTYTVVPGSELCFRFPTCRGRNIVIPKEGRSPVATAAASSFSSSTAVVVSLYTTDTIEKSFVLRTALERDGTPTLKVRGLSQGHLMIKVTATTLPDLSESTVQTKPIQRTLACDFQVVVVPPPHPNPSVEIQELSALLEVSFHSGGSAVFPRARAFRDAFLDAKEFDVTRVEELNRSVLPAQLKEEWRAFSSLLLYGPRDTATTTNNSGKVGAVGRDEDEVNESEGVNREMERYLAASKGRTLGKGTDRRIMPL